LVLCLVCAAALPGQSESPDQSQEDGSRGSVDPVQKRSLSVESSEKGVAWGPLIGESLFFAGLQHGFRLATEPGTVEGLKGKFWPGYGSAIGNLHGWSDGDEFYVNYIGHPLQGAVTNYLWVHNDRAYRTAEFGKNRSYWDSRLRAFGFTFVYSALFEIGPISEASIGKVQRYYPAQGFVDFVVTPVIGTAWMIGEDAADKYIIQRLEGKVNNVFGRAMIRTWLNPARSFANALRFRYPWHRDTRPNVFDYDPKTFRPTPPVRKNPVFEGGVAPWEFDMAFRTQSYLGSGDTSCIGGGGTAARRLTAQWQLMIDVSGCNVMSLGRNQSGDELTFVAGPKWTGNPKGRWKPSAQFLFGGTKMRLETEDPIKKEEVLARPPTPSNVLPPVLPEYLSASESTGLTFTAGGGMDYRINSALQLRLARLEYRRSWLSPLNGYDFSRGLQFSTGLVVQVGTW
jgi:hypothetical protein